MKDKTKRWVIRVGLGILTLPIVGILLLSGDVIRRSISPLPGEDGVLMALPLLAGVALPFCAAMLVLLIAFGKLLTQVEKIVFFLIAVGAGLPAIALFALG